MDRTILKENVKHGDFMFPLIVYSSQNRTEDTIQYCHWHNEMEFLFVTEGKGVFQVENNYHELHAGQAIFVNSGEIHAGYSIDNASCSFYAIVFNPELLYSKNFDSIQIKYFNPLVKKDFRLPVHITGVNGWEKEIITKLYDLVNIFKLKPYSYELITKAYLYLILSTMISSIEPIDLGKKIITNDYETKNIKKALTYIHENYYKKIYINYIAEEINMSVGHFYRFFKQMTRMTPVNYVNYYRINQALLPLRDSDKKISNIAMDVGFENISYFINIFKLHMKCTPTEYRKHK